MGSQLWWVRAATAAQTTLLTLYHTVVVASGSGYALRVVLRPAALPPSADALPATDTPLNAGSTCQARCLAPGAPAPHGSMHESHGHAPSTAAQVAEDDICNKKCGVLCKEL